MDEQIEKLVKDCLQKLGNENFKKEIVNLINKNEEQDVLTIIVNEGVHPNSPDHNHGEVYVASRGNIDFSSKEIVEKEFNQILIGVAKKLKSKPWKKVYLVPFGPAVLSMQIKLLVYRILYIETIDFLYAGHGIYYDLNINLRIIAADS
ncbi:MULTISPECIES: hypothetical protein [unclassified Tolypothrix]|uniref:hypothetical protein n=1 Tax=unclassified Tolypothrix TaxID=2649714 RepID=UPI0005EAA918|nr:MULTISPECIES: hypothetical protein [unclassified Tolypothrix]BAY94370.1 hypothetical protein NIES3275_64180 [Microchaete diplosiphon NIES-3275]EKF04039.1 hypothetical protein FDUTEX481_02864 [Tolypothrix sp. PCC 7601]MBE9086908.1 hypothetical protein [Tolypothrix sp. LEGE 11397]UYD28091.1 hypothetical protein HGR01_08660 [Tolypothrix sp. PCC 7712]UYD36038.1 hypothetical protein HG267_09965 [Tolypothrix sp. PCC 7601]